MKEKADLEEQMIMDHRELERIQNFSKDLQNRISKYEMQILSLQRYLRKERSVILSSTQEDSMDMKMNNKSDMREIDASMIMSNELMVKLERKKNKIKVLKRQLEE